MERQIKPAELKPSAYNVIVPAQEKGRVIVYNTATGALALASEETGNRLRKAAPLSAADGQALGEDAVKLMAGAGFLVEAERDELAELKAAHQALQQDAATFSLCLAPTYACNLACPYCYEKGRDASGKVMDRATQDQVIAFAKAAFEAEPFQNLEIQWYGGEPTLGPEAIERISAELMAFCEQHGLGFSANMLSNAALIDADVAALLKRSGIDEVIVTIDGPEEVHNLRRPARDGSNSYEAVLGGVRNLLAAGVPVVVQMNTDRVNDPLLDELAEQLQREFKVPVMRAKLNDYYGTFGQGRFCEPAFSLMNHPEYTRLQCQRFCEEKHAPQEFAKLMEPIPLFCRGQKERYYCIDALGDVYKCDGRMGRTDHVLFNLGDIAGPADIPTETAPAYPFNDAACTACALLPLCKGTCEWERKCCEDHPCHPLKYTAREYLQSWVKALGADASSDAEFVILSSR